MERIIFINWERISLVIPEKQDLEVMYKAINNVNIIKYLQPIRHNTRETEEKFLNDKIEKADKFFVIMQNDTNEIIWSVWFNEFDDISRNGIIWICLYDESKMSKWYGSEAMNLFLKYSFEYIWYNKVKLQVYSNNPRAISSYKKCWFREVWTFKQDLYIMWEYVDNIAMEMLRNEWDEIKNKRNGWKNIK